jgi:Ca2+-transporting ATPase
VALLVISSDAVTSFSLLSSRRTRIHYHHHHGSIITTISSLKRLRGGGEFSSESIPPTKSLALSSSSNASNEDEEEEEEEAKTVSTAATTTTTTTTIPPSPQRLLEYNVSSIDAGAIPLSSLLKQLQSSESSGLSTEQAASRLLQFGRNALTKAPRKSIWTLILEQFEDRLVQILLLVAVLSGVFSYMEHVQHSGGDEESSSFLSAFVEPLVILTILFINAAIGVWQSQSASDSLAALQELQSASATVMRESSWLANVPATDLVPGDVIQVRVGDKVPADARVVALQSSTLQVDQGCLTGESVTVSKLPGDEGTCLIQKAPIQDQKGMLYSGTMVTSGTALAVVVQTGMDTQMGKIQKGVTQAKEEEPKTPLAIKLDEFGDTLTIIIGVICLAVWIVSIRKMNDPSFHSVWEGAVYYAKVSVALGVAAIPEGLPAVITLCLSLGTRRMAERNVIVRKLQSVETLGCTSVICTDKTGTLTTNEMTVVSLAILEHDATGGETVKEHLVEGVSYAPIGTVQGISYNKEVEQQPLGAISDVAAVCALCNDAKILGKDSEETGKGAKDKIGSSKRNDNQLSEWTKLYERVGEPTEAALCVLAEKLGGMSHYLETGVRLDRSGLHLDVPPSVLASANVDSWREMHPRLATLEFSRDRKSMSVLCAFPQGDFPTPEEFRDGVRARKHGNRLLAKGAPNLLLDRCTHIKFRDGTVSKMTAPLKRMIEQKVAEMAARPLRCLALAIKNTGSLEESLKSLKVSDENSLSKHPLLSNPSTYRDIESGLTLVGIVGIKDPARPEVADSINQCSKAGIRVMMITGDAKATAIAIARDVNILPPEGSERPLKAYEGREFFNLPEHEQLSLLREDNIVFCRAEPADKQKLVKMLQKLGEITAMTGDGVNDAPALSQANLGIAMGITGTEVSKEAADMILADDNFSTIVHAVEEGRRVYANMQAFICFLISCNIGEICAIFFATLAGFPEPLTAMHLLWVNLVTDGPPATALGFNPAAPDLMDQPPRPSDEPIMTRWLLTRYCLTGLYVGVATIGVFAQHYLSQGLTLAQLASWSQCGEFWSPGETMPTCTELFQGTGRMLPQTLALTTLVSMEMLKALSAVSVDNSLFRVGPQENPWLVAGVAGPLLLHLFVLYSSKLGLPGLGESFGMVPLSMDDWVTVLAWAAPILIVDEVLKAVGRWVNNEERALAKQKKKLIMK